MTHLAVNQKNLPPQWQGLTSYLLFSFSETNQDYLNGIIDQTGPTRIIHYYWINYPDRPTQTAIAINQTNQESDHSLPTGLSQKQNESYIIYSEFDTDIVVNDPPPDSFLTFYQITQNLPDFNRSNIEYSAANHFIQLLSGQLPIDLKYINDKIIIGSISPEENLKTFNYYFEPSPNYSDTTLFQKLSELQNQRYIDTNQLEPILIKSCGFNHENLQFQYPSQDIARQIFDQLVTVLSQQNLYEIVEKKLPDNTTTSLHQLSQNTLYPLVTDREIIYQDINNQKTYVRQVEDHLIIGSDPDYYPLPIIFFNQSVLEPFLPPIIFDYLKSITYYPLTQQGSINS